MFTVKNNLNQPLTVSEGTLAAGGELRVRSIDDDLTRLAARGHVTIVEPEKPDAQKAKEEAEAKAKAAAEEKSQDVKSNEKETKK